MIVVTEAMRRDFIVHLAEQCELSLLRADRVRTGTLREQYSMIALHRADAALYAGAAITWSKAEVSA